MSLVSRLQVVDIVSLILNVIFGFVATYIAITLLSYVLSKCGETTRRGIRISRLLKCFCIAAAAFALLHHFIVFASFFVVNQPEACAAFEILWLSTYTFGLLFTYIFLWTRQHTLNSNIGLSELRKKIMLFLSGSALIILILGIVMVFLAGSRLIHFTSCNDDRSNTKSVHLYSVILSAILVTLTVLGQGQLLALFVFPLVHQHQRIGADFREARQQSTSNNNFDQMALVRRCVAAAIACVITDVAAAIITFTVQHQAAQIIYDFNLLVNVLCCVLIFPNWTRMLFPCTRRLRANTISSSAEVCMPVDRVPSV